MIIFDPIPSDASFIMEELIKTCHDTQRMVNVFMNIRQDLEGDAKLEYEEDTSKNLDAIVPFCDKYVTSNSHLFFF